MSALPNLISVEQFRRLPKGECVYELHHGEVVALTRPRARHWKLQLRLARLLGPKLIAFGEVVAEVPYRPIPEFELRAADVAAISRARFDAIDPDDNLRGAPELVIEVKSPSNTERQLRELLSLCLTHGARAFWIVDIEHNSVTVFRQEGIGRVFGRGDAIPLSAFAEGELTVDEIFTS